VGQISDETQGRKTQDINIASNRSLLVADPRRCEPKKFGGPGARARYQKRLVVLSRSHDVTDIQWLNQLPLKQYYLWCGVSSFPPCLFIFYMKA
jgi:hypothetical protein